MVLLMPEVFSCYAAAPKAAPARVFSISVDARGGLAAVLFEHAHTPTNRVAHLARQISAAGKPLAFAHSLLVCSTQLIRVTGDNYNVPGTPACRLFLRFGNSNPSL